MSDYQQIGKCEAGCGRDARYLLITTGADVWELCAPHARTAQQANNDDDNAYELVAIPAEENDDVLTGVDAG